MKSRFGIVGTVDNPLEDHLLAFRFNKGHGRLYHFKEAVRTLWPNRIWHDWSERRAHGLAEYDFVSWTGCGSSGKTDDAGLYAVVWWLADPANSTVVMTSTTGKMIRRRMWPVVQRLYWSCGTLPADLIDSELTLRVRLPGGQRNDKCAIFAKPVKDGNTSKAAADIQGMHNRRVLVIIDEATDTPPAIFAVLPNLMLGCEHFQVLVIANPSSRLDEHGKFSEPLHGWGSITEKDQEWETVVQLNGKPGLCQRFDGDKSPYVITGDATLRFLIGARELETAKLKLGERSPEYWKYYRGLWAPAGVCNTVLDEITVMENKATEGVIFDGRTTMFAGLDPGFGGDSCVLAMGELGDVDGRPVLVLRPDVEIKTDASSGTPLDKQIAEQTMVICRDARVAPENAGCDSTGSGQGVYGWLHESWGSGVKRVDFGGAASELPVGDEDERSCRDVYDRKVTELWFSVARLVKAGRLKGMGMDAMKDFCTRTYEHKQRKYHIQKKEDMRELYGRSPDHGDAVAVLVDVARRSGLLGWAGERTRTGREWEQFAKDKLAIYDQPMYEPLEIGE